MNSLRINWPLQWAFSVFVIGLTAQLAPSAASAQGMDPEGGDVYESPAGETPPGEPAAAVAAPPEEGTPGGPSPWYQGGPTGLVPEPEAAPEAEAEPVAGTTAQAGAADDHTRMVGRFAFGTMGTSSVPVGQLVDSTGAINPTSVSAPALGVRYWLSDMLGIDAGLGIGLLTGSANVGDASSPLDDSFAMTIHGGVPLALYHAEHYVLLVIPEVNIGFSTGTVHGATQEADRGAGGFLFQLGGRVGTEIHFGFMDIPELSLQASVGLYFTYLSASLGEDQLGTPASGQNVSTLESSVNGEPWDILLGSLSALYYF